MTARHVVRSPKLACRVKARVDGRWVKVTRTTYWTTDTRSNGQVEDLATLRLASSTTGHIFDFRTSSPRIGTNLAMVGHPLGNELSLTQGKLLARKRVGQVPIIFVNLLGGEGASGSAFVDNEGKVVGVLQLGLGSADILGQRTAGVVAGIDLATWWRAGARGDLCRAYPLGGIPDCGDPAPDPPDEPDPPPPPPPAGYKIATCWIQYSGGDTRTWDVSKKLYQVSGTEMLANGHNNYSAVIQLEGPAPATIFGVQVQLITPNRRIFASESFTWDATYSLFGYGLGWTWSNGAYFWQHPEITTTQPPGWSFVWRFPDGQTCTWYFTVT